VILVNKEFGDDVGNKNRAFCHRGIFDALKFIPN